MRWLLWLILFGSALLAELDVKGFVAMDSQFYMSRPADKHAQNFTLQEQLELTYSEGDLEAVGVLYAQQDGYDLWRC